MFLICSTFSMLSGFSCVRWWQLSWNQCFQFLSRRQIVQFLPRTQECSRWKCRISKNNLKKEFFFWRNIFQFVRESFWSINRSENNPQFQRLAKLCFFSDLNALWFVFVLLVVGNAKKMISGKLSLRELIKHCSWSWGFSTWILH